MILMIMIIILMIIPTIIIIIQIITLIHVINHNAMAAGLPALHLRRLRPVLLRG